LEKWHPFFLWQTHEKMSFQKMKTMRNPNFIKFHVAKFRGCAQIPATVKIMGLVRAFLGLEKRNVPAAKDQR